MKTKLLKTLANLVEAGDVVDFQAFKDKMEESKKNQEEALDMLSNRFSQPTNSGFKERIEKIRKSLNTVDKLMTELKDMSDD